MGHKESQVILASPASDYVSGTILTESVFNWPGLGLLSYESMMNRDYPVMQAVFLLASVAVILANLIADIMYYYLDPRVKA